MTACTAVQCQKTYEIGECRRERAVSFVDFVWRGAAGRGGDWGVERGGARRAAQVGLLEQVQHEDVAEGSEADTPQEAPFRCQMDNNSDDGRDNRRPPLRACRARVIAERR